MARRILGALLLAAFLAACGSDDECGCSPLPGCDAVADRGRDPVPGENCRADPHAATSVP